MDVIKELYNKLIKYENPTIHSHYVQKKYLKNWSLDNKLIYTSIDSGDFNYKSLKTVCINNKMYKLDALNDSEISFLCALYSNHNMEYYSKIFLIFNKKLANIKNAEINIENDKISCIIDGINEKEHILNLLDNYKIQLGEDIQTDLEHFLDEEIIKEILNFKEDFLNDKIKLWNFSNYIYGQYLRTKKAFDIMTTRIEKIRYYNKDFPLVINKSQNFNNHLFFVIVQICSYVLTMKTDLHIKFIESKDGLLYTSDQPIINIAENIDIDFAKFYYPITPNVGIIFPSDKYEKISDDIELINELNTKIINNSKMFVFKMKKK